MAGAYCALCGTEIDVQEPLAGYGAACGSRCAAALQAVASLRQREQDSVQVAVRRRAEYEHGVEHPLALSDILLTRWRAGDWTINPNRVLAQLAANS